MIHAYKIETDGPIDLKGFLQAIEKDLIHVLLEKNGGNKAHAARALGINRTTLIEKMRRYGFPLLPPPGVQKC